MRLLRRAGFALVTFLVAALLLASNVGQPVASADTVNSPFGLIGLSANRAVELNAFWGKLVIPWRLVEPTPGSLEFEPIEQEIAKLGPINLVGLLKANAPWAISCRRFVGTGNSCPVRDAHSYAQYVYQTVNHFKDRISVWQIEDEVYSPTIFGGTPDDYLVLLEAAAAALRQADPAATILIASTNLNTNKAYRQRLMSVLTHTNLYDVIDLHVAAEPEILRPAIEQFKDELRSSEIDKPIWVTELKGSEQTPEKLVKAHVIAFSLGIKKIFWFGELDELSTKAYSLMASLLTNYSISATLPNEAEASGALFQFRRGRPIAVAWSDSEQELDLSSVMKPPYQVFDAFGRRRDRRGAKVSLNPQPLYLVGSSLLPETRQSNPSAVQVSKSRLLVTLPKRSFRVGEVGSASIVIEPADQVYLAEVALTFPQDLIRVRRVDHTSSDFSLVLTEQIDNAKGQLTLAKARVSQPGKDRLILANVSFEALNQGTGSFSFNGASEQGSRLLNLARENLLNALTSTDFAVQ